MRIDESDAVSRLRGMLDRLEDGERQGRADGAARPTEPAGGRADMVEVSARAQEIRQLRDAIAASPELRQQLVDSLREEIASGRYRIDGSRIADALLSETL